MPREHWTSSRRGTFHKGRIRSKKPLPRRANLCTLGCISSPRCFICPSWWCVDPEDDVEETSAYRSSPIKVRYDVSTDYIVEPFSFTITYMDPDIAGKSVHENNTQLLWWHWPGDDESILTIVTSIINTTTLSIVNAAFANQPEHSWKTWDLWGFQEERNGDGGPYTRNVNPIVYSNTAAGCVKAATKLKNTTLFCVVHRG